MKWKEIMSKAPNGIVAVCITVFAMTVVLAFAALAWKSGDMTELRSLINTLFNFGTLILSGGSFLAAGASARSADQAARQTNGELDHRIQVAVQRAIDPPLTSKDSGQ